MNSPQPFLARDAVTDLLRLGSLVAMAIGLFAIVIAGTAIYLNLSEQLALERSDRAASQQADRIADRLSEIQTSLRDASVVDAARSGSGDGLRAALRERGVVNLLQVRLLPADVDELAAGTDIARDRAARDMVIEAIENDRADIRVLQPGTPAESLVFAQRMPGDSGVLLLRLTVGVVGNLLHRDELLDFVALAQQGNPGSTVLDARGGGAATTHSIPIEGSSLVLQWGRAGLGAPVNNRDAFIVGCAGVIVMMIGLLLRRRTRLAQHLGYTETVATGRAKPSEPPGARSTRPGAPGAAPRDHSAIATDPGRTKDRAILDAANDESEPQTIVAPAPELPEWLLDDFDDSPDEPAADNNERSSNQRRNKA
ncbi:hypothetical protein G4Y73_08950 [Wenzhouxiangella sp. XN201]|uniref:hypothetical protein n=1 Tax=Wenzhouxiangella sp. XN201 TaxID=2710755 RepID=UPI0013C689B5|nr:hypothetical protein [Wenzhouxiangella sp. XN201]NEZ04270.1 hypothetical protein [Wenzhouxiangella sp. XN201]